MKRILSLLLFVFPLMAINSVTTLTRAEKGFNLHVGDRIHEIKSYDVDQRLQSLDNTQLTRLAAAGCLKAHAMNNGDYRVEMGGGLKGGGGGGATAGFWAGRFLGQVVGYTAVAIVCLPAMAGGPVAYTVAVGALAGTCAPVIESASHVTALVGGLVGGVTTGPV